MSTLDSKFVNKNFLIVKIHFECVGVCVCQLWVKNKMNSSSNKSNWTDFKKSGSLWEGGKFLN